MFSENGVGSLEDHFRKSLGEDYSRLFKAGGREEVEEEAGRGRTEENKEERGGDEDTTKDMTGYTGTKQNKIYLS